MTGLEQAVEAAIRRGRNTGAVLGRVAAIDGTNLALTIDIGTGTPLSGVRWVGSYIPAVADFVTVLQVGSAWVVLGKLSKNLTGPGFTEHTTQIAPAAWADGQRMVGAADWSWYAPGDAVYQGRFGDASWTDDYAGVLFYPSISSSIPSGATIVGATIRIVRGDDHGLALTYPILHGHALPGLPPSYPLDGPSLPWVSGYGPLTLPTIAKSATAYVPLPSTWVTALLAGTLTGLAFQSEAPADYMSFLLSSGVITITYRIPA